MTLIVFAFESVRTQPWSVLQLLKLEKEVDSRLTIRAERLWSFRFCDSVSQEILQINTIFQIGTLWKTVILIVTIF